jgi:single-stranded DNA-binding protein
MIVEGKITEKFDTQTIKETFKKREFVLEFAENPQYPEFIKFELIQSNCEQLDSINPGDEVIVNFNLKGRKWTDPKGEVKYFNSLQAWRVDVKTDSAPTGNDSPPPPTQEWMKEDFSKDDDLPF